MAFRALLFSKHAETTTVMTAACGNTGIRVEVRSDIFTAIDLVKMRAFSCVIVDWADQPEATFLLKRARESGSNQNTVAIAVVDHEPSPSEMRDNRLDYLIYRPIADDEAGAVLTKASEKMEPSSVESDKDEESPSAVDNKVEGATVGGANHTPPVSSGEAAEHAKSDAVDNYDDGENAIPGEGVSTGGRRSPGLIIACVATAVIAAVFFLLKSTGTVGRLSQAPVQTLRGVRDSIATLFPRHQAVPVNQSTNSASQDPYFSRDTNSTGQQPALDVVAPTSILAENSLRLPIAFDFPLPEPVLQPQPVAPLRVQRAAIPDSMKASPPIAPPLVVTVNPAQMMPVSAPLSQPAIQQQISEPVVVSEESARTLLIHTVNPIYPAEGLQQKLHGAVVLQALIGRDGNVEDLKIVRGYFVLGKAAIAAVKQWRFQPYTINGHAVSTQTVVTVNFSYPPG